MRPHGAFPRKILILRTAPPPPKKRSTEVDKKIQTIDKRQALIN